MNYYNQPYFDMILQHYSACWNGDPTVLQFNVGPFHELPLDFRVLRFAPSERRSMWTYATVCMSQPEDRDALELHIFAPSANDDIVEILVATAHYHRNSKQLGLGHSVNFGKPWWIGSQCSYGLISLPYLDGPMLELLENNDNKVQFLWLIPVTKSEIEFKKISGLEALEKKFDLGQIDYLNPLREAVA